MTRVLALMAIAIAAVAQQRPNGFYLTTPLGLSYGYDDNFISSGAKVSDQSTLVNAPSFAWRRSAHRDRFSVDYQPEFQIFSHHRDLNSWNHLGRVHFTHQISGRITLDAGDYFLSTNDPTRTLENSLLLLPLGGFRQNAVYTELGYRLDRKTKLAFRLDNAVTKTSLSGDAAGKLNQISAGGTISLEHIIDVHHTVSANIGYLWARNFDTVLYGRSTGMEVVNGGYDYTPNPGLVFRFSGGLVRANPTAFTGAATVEKKLGSAWVGAGYRRYLNFFGALSGGAPASPGPVFAGGLAPDSVYQVVSLRAWGNLTKSLAILASGEHALIGLNAQRLPIRGNVARLRLEQKLTNRFALFAISEYYGQNLNEIAGTPMARARYLGGLNVTLTKPPVVETKPKRRTPPPDDPKKDAGRGDPPEER